MQVKLDLVKELLKIHHNVKQGYINSNNPTVDLKLNDALARLDVLINLLKGE